MAKQKRKLQNTKKTFTVKVPAANRNYKDTVFRMLFSNRKNLLSLYNAVNQRDYKNPDDLEIVTLENAIYMGMKNDLAFIIDTNLYLYEHQSTYNPNIPLRDLFYISNEYQKLVDKKSLYSSTLQKIPAPNFIEFYNGSTILSDCTELKLSSAFENLSGEPKLELTVTVLNVNEGHNAELMQHCSTLKEYAQYVARVRHYAANMSSSSGAGTLASFANSTNAFASSSNRSSSIAFQASSTAVTGAAVSESVFTATGSVK